MMLGVLQELTGGRMLVEGNGCRGATEGEMTIDAIESLGFSMPMTDHEGMDYEF